MRLVIVMSSLLLLTVPTLADPLDCYPPLDLEQNPLDPVAYSVASPGKLHFASNETDKAGCPGPTDACRRKGYLLPGDHVIATSVIGDYACATFTSSKPPYQSSEGWLPLASLVAEGSATDWTGEWYSGDEKQILISALEGSKLSMDGAASYGTHDPGRVARGAINVGEFRATVSAGSGSLAFNIVGDNVATTPYSGDPADASCGLRLWRRGPYLVASDNAFCGGNNVRFNGVYARGN